MATRRSSKSSKTEHVLNLLSGTPQNESAPQEQADEQDLVKKESPESTPQKKVTVPVLEVARANHEKTANTITNALDDALKKELEDQNNSETLQDTTEITESEISETEGSETESSKEVASESAEQEILQATQPEISPQKDSTVNDSEAENAQGTANTESDTPQENSEKKQQNAQSAAVDDKKGQDLESAEFINVMEELVDDMIGKYISMFGVCECHRCHADIKACALSRLPSKYVVLTKSTRMPMMNFYGAQYNTIVKNQIIFACDLVKRLPRHTGDFRKDY